MPLKSMPKSIIVAFCTLFCSACAFQPTVATQQPYADNCQMQTKQLTLSEVNMTNVISCQGHSHDALACLVIQGVIAPVGSFIISGSIVAVNNTFHWLEYHGTCDTTAISEKAEAFKETVKIAPPESS